MAVEPIAEQPEHKVEPVKAADLVLGVVADIDQESLITLCDSLRTLPGSPIVAALRNDHAGGTAGATSEASEKVPSPYFVPWPSSKTDDPGTPIVNIATAYQSAFAVSEQLNARACSQRLHRGSRDPNYLDSRDVRCAQPDAGDPPPAGAIVYFITPVPLPAVFVPLVVYLKE